MFVKTHSVYKVFQKETWRRESNPKYALFSIDTQGPQHGHVPFPPTSCLRTTEKACWNTFAVLKYKYDKHKLQINTNTKSCWLKTFSMGAPHWTPPGLHLAQSFLFGSNLLRFLIFSWIFSIYNSSNNHIRFSHFYIFMKTNLQGWSATGFALLPLPVVTAIET